MLEQVDKIVEPVELAGMIVELVELVDMFVSMPANCWFVLVVASQNHYFYPYYSIYYNQPFQKHL